MALQITDENFKTEVLEKGGVAVLDFWAVWCGPCRLIGPIIDQLSEEYEGRAIIGKVDVDNNPDIATQYGIRSIPTVVFLKHGSEVKRQVGVATKAALIKILDEILQEVEVNS
ncbi:MAG: thioredoxin [Bacteroidota bacterium]